jgi:hypothetical protein
MIGTAGYRSAIAASAQNAVTPGITRSSRMRSTEGFARSGRPKIGRAVAYDHSPILCT